MRVAVCVYRYWIWMREMGMVMFWKINRNDSPHPAPKGHPPSGPLPDIKEGRSAPPLLAGVAGRGWLRSYKKLKLQSVYRRPVLPIVVTTAATVKLVYSVPAL